jgi:sugar-specific transcriptional regulator TrmB
MSNEIKNLVNIGLSEKEAIVFLSLHKLGETTAYKISKDSEIKEPTVYTILQTLTGKGLVFKIPNSKKQVFIAQSLDKYIDKINESLINARKISLDLKNKNKQQEKPKVLLFEGLNQVKKAVYYGLEDMSGDTLLQTYGGLTNSIKAQIDKTYLKWNKEVIKMNIKQKILISHKEVEQHKDLFPFIKKDKLEIRFIEKEIDFPWNISLNVNPKFVSIFAEDPFQATVITDKKLIHILTEYHKFFWERATPLVLTD